jgi:hypothetical protein
MARRAEAPKSLRYFEQAIADAHAELDRPLPVGVASAAVKGGARTNSNESTSRSVSDVLCEMAQH